MEFTKGRKPRVRVLIVDDEPMMTDLLKMVVEADTGEPGFEVRTASDLAGASELVRTWRPSVVLLDLVLPDGDGVSLLRNIKKDDLGIEVIIVSGQGTIQRALEAGRAGAFQFIEKSDFDPVTVLTHVRGAVTVSEKRGQRSIL